MQIQFNVKELSFVGELKGAASKENFELTLTCEQLEQTTVITSQETIAELIGFGANQKFQNNYAGKVKTYKEEISKAMVLWEEGYFTLRDKERALNPPSAKTSGGSRATTAMAVKIYNSLEGDELVNAKALPIAILVDAYKKARPEQYAEFEAELKAEKAKEEEEAKEMANKLFA